MLLAYAGRLPELPEELQSSRDGLDHGIGHLASMSPQKNERLPPSKVEMRGRPRHP
jgi:hypothetical protein